ncbi:hypothetical protein M8J77_000034 [Diaphorina citri]|nr:hypothetical protein M8J77_000034 [Diaphorina citri]
MSYLLCSYFVKSNSADKDRNERKLEDGEVQGEKTTANRKDFEFKAPEDKRLPRFLSFNNDVSNIRVEMVFAVPFLAIPIGGKDESGNTTVIPKVDINLKSLFATGVIVFMLFFVIPKLVKLYLPPAPSHRGLKDTEFARILRNVDEALHGHNIDSTACTQKFICYAVSNAAQRVAHGQGSSMDKIVDGVLGIQWLRNLIRVDSIREAINLSNEENNCQIYHRRCPVTKGRLYGAAGSLLDAINKSKHDQSHRRN